MLLVFEIVFSALVISWIESIVFSAPVISRIESIEGGRGVEWVVGAGGEP